MTTFYSRRRFIRQAALGAAAGTVLAPFVKQLERGGAQAQPAEIPKRFLVMFSPNGTIPSQWTPSGTGTEFTFRRILAPLEPHRARVLVTSGLNMSSTLIINHDAHQAGMGHALTAIPLLPGDTQGGCETCPPSSWAGGPSVDQVIADRIGTTTKLRSLELGVGVDGRARIYTRMCYRAAGQPLPPMNSPVDAYVRVFGDPNADADAVRNRLARRQSLLDHQLESLDALQRRLSAVDRERLEVHTEAVRDLERRLEAYTGTCNPPDLRPTPDIPSIGRMHADILAMAFACDLTRVGSIQWYHSGAYVPLPWIGVGERHHDLAHDTSPGSIEKLVRINTWYAEQFAYLIARLESVPQGTGTLADHTVLFWSNELSRGDLHIHTGMPFLMAGNIPRASDGQPTFATGRHVPLGGRAHNDLFITFLQAYGIETNVFGSRQLCSGPITQLLAA